MSTVQISLDSIRENQLAEISERNPTFPKGQTDLARFLLFDTMEKLLKVKKA